MAHPNADLIRKLFGAVVSKDAATISQLVAEDIVVHVSGDNQLAGTHKGREEFFTVMGKADEITGGLERELHDVTASDEHAVALVRVGCERGGKRISWNGANIFHVQGGKLTELWLVTDDPAATDEAFA